MTLRRITIMIQDDILIKCRKLQSKRILKENKSVSLSNVIDQILRDELK